MSDRPVLYLGLSVTATMTALADIAAGGFLAHGPQLALLALIAGGALSLSALTWRRR